MPVPLRSPNAIAAEETFTAFLIAVLAGARRFAHTALLPADGAFHALLGVKRFPTDDTIRNFFKRFRQGLALQFYEPLWAWQLARVTGFLCDPRVNPRLPAFFAFDIDALAGRSGEFTSPWRRKAAATNGRAPLGPTKCRRLAPPLQPYLIGGMVSGEKRMDRKALSATP
jgi:hypothetical protein